MARELVVPEGWQVDTELMPLHIAALAAVKASGCTYVEAVKMLERSEAYQAVFATYAEQPPRGSRVTLRLYAAAASANGKFSGLAYSGNAISYHDERFAIDLSSMSLPPGGRVPILVNHDANRVAGRAIAEIHSGALWVRDGEFSKVTPAGREAAGLYAESQPLKLSVGVSGERDYVQGGAMVNGRQQNVSTVLRKSRLLEVSIVPAGADPAATLN